MTTQTAGTDLVVPVPDGAELAVRVRGLRKAYGETRACDGVDLDVVRGEVLALLGPNGAGKTTTLRMLSTVLRPTSGRAWVAGYDVQRQPAEVRARIGYMSASTGIYDRMTGWELVEYFGSLYGIDRDPLRARMEQIFDWLQMNDFRDTLCGKLSTGMKQKVSIARTIVHDPPVLIFDEPTSGLDVLVARALRQHIVELCHQGKTIVFSSHDMNEVAKLCARVGIIHKGTLRAVGTPEELLARYKQPDLEELFFYLVDHTGAPGAVA